MRLKAPPKATAKAPALLAGLIAALFLAVWASPLRAEVKITVTNNYDFDLMIAFCWMNQDDWDRDGWRRVGAGETKTFALGAAFHFAQSSMGYYAKGGGLEWKGDPAKKTAVTDVWIHPTEDFTGSFSGYEEFEEEDKVPGGTKVFFRRINIVPSSRDAFHGKGSLVFGP